MRNIPYLLTILLLLATSCVSRSEQSETTETTTTEATADGTTAATDATSIVDVMVFHPAEMSETDEAILKAAREAVDQYSSELPQGYAVYVNDVDLSTEEGMETAKKYGVSGTALYVVKWFDRQEWQREDMTEEALRDALTAPETLRDNIKGMAKALFENR